MRKPSTHPPRIDELPFTHEAALIRGDGSGAAVILRSAPRHSGPVWAKVVSAGAGIDPGYLFIEYHSSDAVVFAVDGSVSSSLPREAYLDARLHSQGSFLEYADPDEAREADRRFAAETARVRAAQPLSQTSAWLPQNREHRPSGVSDSK